MTGLGTSTVALTRAVPSSIVACELTHLAREPIDIDRARAQHAAYEATLRSLGLAVARVPAADDLPDSVFVEDTALVFDELAVIARPGAPSRRPETAAVEEALARYRRIARLTEPATLDGGDVLVLGRRVLVGLSTRTNADAVKQLAERLAPFGYTVEEVRVRGCLHLKSAATAVGPEAVVCNPDWIDPAAFAGLDVVTVDPREPSAANVLRIGGGIVAPAAHPRTSGRLSRFAAIHPVDVSELAKAEAGVTCCSVIVR